MFRMFFFLSVLTFCLSLNGQDRTEFTITSKGTVNLREINVDWKTKVQHMEAPSPDGDSYRSFLEKKKKDIEEKYSGRSSSQISTEFGEAENPIIVREFDGNVFGGGVPNDNTLAISNDGKIVSCVNSNLFVFEEGDSILLNVSLEAFGDTLGLTAHKYDPKVRYDQEADRFILTYLSGNTDSTTNIIVAFSASNDPAGDWNLYALPGNPYNNNYWSDYPALGITKEDFFITINLIESGVSWQEGFRGTLIWQIDKSTGYAGEDLTSVMWDDIRFGGEFIRNMHPISGGSELKDEIYFLSNRNFDEINDTIFIIHVTGETNDASSELEVKFGITDTPYGMPPNGRQIGAHRLATNDARVLGGFMENGKIQFVANTINHDNGNASVYHGFIDGYETDNPSIQGNILSDSTDWGYPNIAYTGRYEGDDEAVINFNYVHPQVFSSCGVIYYQGREGTYSDKITTKEGGVYVDLISGTDRWGDYSGMQRKYNEPGVVWCTGTYGAWVPYGGSSYKGNQTYITKVFSPDSNDVYVPVDTFAFNLGPNPTADIVSIYFSLEETATTSIYIYDINGKIVKKLIEDEMKSGTNMLSFSSAPLSEGIYFVSIYSEGVLVQTEKLVKQ